MRGFERFDIPVDGDVSIAGVHAGNGPAVLLLHGHPQSHATWHEVAPRLGAAGYRVVATIDLEHDAADAHRRITVPVLVLWGARGVVGQLYDVLATWREKAVDVRGEALDCGHALQEEAPGQTAVALLEFLQTGSL
jgi:pimeloyl-ACP methyl ester carboxylesterase